MSSQYEALRHGSLFSGIGGFDLAAQWCGWKNVFHCEINEFCNYVLNYYWPKAVAIKNIIGYEWKKWKGKVDVLSGGWPCQKYSVAGRRTGNEPLKDAMLTAIRGVRPTWCVLENVYGFITKKFAPEHYLLCQQLEGLDYDVQTFDIDAASCGVPTVERHIWIVATSRSQRLERNYKEKVPNISVSKKQFPGSHPGMFDRWTLPESRVCNLGEGISDELDTKAFSKKKWHQQSLLAIGNAIVPQVALQLFRNIQQTMFKRNAWL